MEKLLEQILNTLDRLETNQAQTNERLSAIDCRLDRIEGDLYEVKGDVRLINEKLDNIATELRSSDGQKRLTDCTVQSNLSPLLMWPILV